ncbi:MAG: hypothetical protein MJZ16_05090 [Bacteroidales bacterium]|nr:hypothetical protein [Bacteroidales bacterium]
MTTFIGEYTGKVDDKGRIVFPSAFKSLMLAEGGDMRLVVKKGMFSNCLEMYTYAEWERQSNEVLSKLNIFLRREDAIFWSKFTRGRDIVEPDAKFGRITIDKKLLEAIGVTKEVVFSGNDFRIEIWSKEEFEKSDISTEEFLAIAERLSER